MKIPKEVKFKKCISDKLLFCKHRISFLLYQWTISELAAAAFYNDNGLNWYSLSLNMKLNKNYFKCKCSFTLLTIVFFFVGGVTFFFSFFFLFFFFFFNFNYV